MTMARMSADIDLPMERPLHSIAAKAAIAAIRPQAGDESLDAAVLFTQFVVDKAALAQHVRQALQQRTQVTLRELLEDRPLQHGLAELVAFLQLAAEDGAAAIDETVEDLVSWPATDGAQRRARLPRVIFSRP